MAKNKYKPARRFSKTEHMGHMKLLRDQIKKEHIIHAERTNKLMMYDDISTELRRIWGKCPTAFEFHSEFRKWHRMLLANGLVEKHNAKSVRYRLTWKGIQFIQPPKENK